MVEPVKPTSKDLKERLAHHLYWRLQYPIVCDEFEFIDVIGVRRTGYVVEFEIKVSKSDFDREFRCISATACENYGKDWEKFAKHKTYLTGERPKTNYDSRLLGFGIKAPPPFRPSEFYFYVPEYLADHAVRKISELGLPYGVVVYNYPYKNGFVDPYYIMKKADKLHSEKATNGLYYKLAHALTARSRLLNYGS